LDSSLHGPDTHLRAGWLPTPDGTCHLRYKQKFLITTIQWFTASTITTQHKYLTNDVFSTTIDFQSFSITCTNNLIFTKAGWS
jgi:hypothetical protein